MINSNELEENFQKEKLSQESQPLKEAEEYKMIGRKRNHSRNEKSASQMHNGDGGQEEKNSAVEINGPKMSKKKSKKGQKEYVVPQRVPWKSSELLGSIIDRIILKFDPLLILRGYRDKLKEDPQFNNFKTRRIEKLITLQDSNSSLRLKIDFSKSKFSLEINKSLIENPQIVLDSLSAANEEPPSNELPKINSSNPQNESHNSQNVSHSEIKLIDSNYQSEIDKQFDNKYIDTLLVENVDILKYKLECNYYLSLEDFLTDCNYMFSKLNDNIHDLLSGVEENKEAFLSYITTIYLELVKQVSCVKTEFKESLEKDIKTIILNNKLPKIVSSFKNIPQKKEYQTISEYEHIFPEITTDKVKTDLKPSCKGGCCDSYEDLGPLNLEKGKWDSKCKDREHNLECDPALCGCGDNCKNMAIRKRTSKKLNEDVVEKYAWGIDLFTFRNLMEFLPMNFDDNFKKDAYIEKHLVKALNDQDTEGHSIVPALESLRSKTDCLDREDKLSEHLARIFQESDAAKTSSSTVYSKGIGIFCRKEGGVKQNELISIYLGEIYPPWYWYEKQDLIKKNKLDKELPDFYNIMLERLKRDERGYDLVMVDPNSKGNFASRMSHSCVPNCNTVLMCSDETYQIGMFATKEIACGDELTFDYNSVTEKEKEFQDAICLCSSFECRGHYLIYSNSVLFTEVLSTHHSFLHRNAVLLHACDPSFEENKTHTLLPGDRDLLKEYSIGSSILGKAPFWVQKWAVLALRFVKVESHLLPQLLSHEPKKPKKEGCQFITEDSNTKSENGKSNGSTRGNKPVKRNKTVENVSNKEKFNFDRSNFIYPGMKSYQSSTRGKKQKTEEVKTDVEEILSHSYPGEVSEKTQQQTDSKEENRQEEITQVQNTNDLIKVENNYSDIQTPLTIEETQTKINHLEPNSDENKSLDVSTAKIGITENRIQNIAITIDKVLHVLKLMKTNEPPLVVLSQKEIWQYYWGKEDSIRENLERNLRNLERNSELCLIKDRITSIRNYLKYDTFETSNVSEEEYHNKNKRTREIFKSVAIKIKVCSNLEKSGHYVFYEGLADVLFLYASTETYFKSNKNYQSCNSEKISIRKRDINVDLLTGSLDAAVCDGEKSYDKLYTWGQLIGWFKQTVDKPNASLSAERRGSLSYPEIDSFFLSNVDFGKQSKSSNCFNYPCGTRKGFYEKLIETPSMMWPVGNDWSYKNKNKIYGTIQFDSILKHTENVQGSSKHLVDTLKRMEESFNNMK